jgi:hypothetical protein
MNNNKQQIRLYFNEQKICLGGLANDWWQADFSGNYWASDCFWLPVGYNPTGKSLDQLSHFI